MNFPDTASYIQTRTSLFAARLLPPGALPLIVDRGLDEVRDVLEKAQLTHFVGDDGSAASTTLENRIVHTLLAEIEILARAFHGRERQFLVHWARRFEIANLKAIARGKAAGRPASELRRELMDLGTLSVLPVEELLQTEGLAEFLARLARTAYGDIAREARIAFEQAQDFFALDAAVDRRYYVDVVNHAKALGATSDTALGRLMGATLDRVNLVWLLRYRLAYGLPPAQIYYLLVPAPYRLTASRLRELATLSDLGAILETLPEPYLSLLAGSASTGEVRARMERMTYDEAARILRSTAPALARVFAYLILRERDLRQVRAVIRGKSLDFARDVLIEGAGLDEPLGTA